MSSGSPTRPSGYMACELFQRVRLVVPVRGADGAGGNDVEADAHAAVAGGEVLGHGDLAGLCRGVLDVAEGGEAVDRADRDDVAVGFHQVREGRLDAAGGADQGEVELAVPVFVSGVLGHRGDDAAAGVVHQHVESAEPLDRRRDRGVDVRARR